jgi:hypothetical protein
MTAKSRKPLTAPITTEPKPATAKEFSDLIAAREEQQEVAKNSLPQPWTDPQPDDTAAEAPLLRSNAR